MKEATTLFSVFVLPQFGEVFAAEFRSGINLMTIRVRSFHARVACPLPMCGLIIPQAPRRRS